MHGCKHPTDLQALPNQGAIVKGWYLPMCFAFPLLTSDSMAIHVAVKALESGISITGYGEDTSANGRYFGARCMLKMKRVRTLFCESRWMPKPSVFE